MENDKRIVEIKDLIRDECYNLGKIDDWFYEKHLLAVEKFANDILEKLPEANREIVLLGVWLHDLQRIRGLDGDHQEIGASEAEKVMQEFGYSEDVIKNVKDIVLSHSCENILPDTIEGKILATADAMSLQCTPSSRQQNKLYKIDF